MDNETRLRELENRIYELEHILMPFVLLQKRLDFIERLIDGEEYDKAREEINGTRRYFGEVPELHGLIAHIDMITFLEEHPDDGQDTIPDDAGLD